MNLLIIQNNLKELSKLINGVRIQVSGIRDLVDGLQSDFKKFSSEIDDIKAIVANRQRAFRVHFDDRSSINIVATDLESARAEAIAKYRLPIDSIHEIPDPPTF